MSHLTLSQRILGRLKIETTHRDVAGFSFHSFHCRKQPFAFTRGLGPAILSTKKDGLVKTVSGRVVITELLRRRGLKELELPYDYCTPKV